MTASHDHPTPEPTSTTRVVTDRRIPRVSTIIWGVVILVIAGLRISAIAAPAAVDGRTVVVSSLLVLGAALVIGGIWAATRERRRARRDAALHR